MWGCCGARAPLWLVGRPMTTSHFLRFQARELHLTLTGFGRSMAEVIVLREPWFRTPDSAELRHAGYVQSGNTILD